MHDSGKISRTNQKIMQNEKKQDQDKVPNVEKEGWNVKELAEESTNEMPDETLRGVLRGDAKPDNADEKDIVGATDPNDTPRGREDNKNEETRSDS